MSTIRKYLALILIFVMYESFGLLPEALAVPIPGDFRISHSFFIAIPFVYMLSFRKFFFIFQEHTHATLIVLFGCLLVIFGIAMAQYNFGQPFLTGLLKLRQLLTLFLFFILLALISDEKETVFFIRGLFSLVGVIGVLSLIQYVNPSIPIFRGVDIETLYSGEKLFRHGSYRIVFPTAALGVLMYFYVLGELIAIKNPQHFYWKLGFLVLLFLLFYLQQTRARLLAIVIITIYALITSKKSNYKIAAFVLALIFTCSQLLSYAVSNKGLIDPENSRILKLTDSVFDAFESKDPSINDRLQQVDMYWHYFKQYPVFGAGTLAIESPLSAKVKLYNTSDIGYMKLICEYGIIGLFWFVWLFVWVFKRTGKTSFENSKSKNLNLFIGIIKGTRLFYFYLAVTMLTLPHFGRGHTIIYMVISIVLLELVVKLSTKTTYGQMANH